MTGCSCVGAFKPLVTEPIHMTLFRNLFRFHQKEVRAAFDCVIDKHYYRGLKLLKTALTDELLTHGKLLIVTPRAVGKAYKRNKIRRQIKNIYYQEKCYENRSVWVLIVTDKATKIPFDALKAFLVTTMRQEEQS